MSRAVAIDQSPRRSKCSECSAQVWRLSAARGRPILIDRDGNKPLPKTKLVPHRCAPRKEP